jgi:hypothetical protein
MREYQRRNHFPAQNWISQCNYLAAEACKKFAHSPQKMLREKIAHKICSQ